VKSLQFVGFNALMLAGGCDQVCDFWSTDFSARNLPATGTTSVLASIVFPRLFCSHLRHVSQAHFANGNGRKY
jgi:hypothetical protein